MSTRDTDELWTVTLLRGELPERRFPPEPYARATQRATALHDLHGGSTLLVNRAERRWTVDTGGYYTRKRDAAIANGEAS